MPIRVLPPALAARIAAGEVVERPASVVKELVENSLDAGATRIAVEVLDGGKGLVRVVDNGSGIRPDEVATAFERFATSKIDETSDLMGISTLGFRGEALPSIASVARVELTSYVVGQSAGVRATVEFGGPVAVESTGAPEGTTLAVRDLFRNTPARLKFLGSAGTELGRVHQVVATYALTRPDVAISLTADGGPRFSTTGRGDLLEAAASVYGWHVAKELLKIEAQKTVRLAASGFSVSGLTSTPGLTRGNRSYMTIAVNGRWVESRRLLFAVEQAYHGFLSERRYPVAVLLLTVPPGDVDVNVHPAKTEVRFLREQVVFAEVQRAVRAVLVEAAPVPHASMPQPRSPAAWPDNPLWPEQQATADSTPVEPNGGLSPESQAPAPGATPQDTRPTPGRSLPVLRIIGQAHDTYLLAEGPNGVYLIDQHAAHERVLFEEIRARLGRPAEGGQRLLAPESVQLLPHHERLLKEHAEVLAEAGFDVEPFGPRTAIVRAIPRVLAGSSGADALVRLLDSIGDGTGTTGWRERVLATIACHSAVRAGRRMTIEESQELVRKLETVDQPHTCPHGRPTMIYLSVSALERDFSRR